MNKQLLCVIMFYLSGHLSMAQGYHFEQIEFPFKHPLCMTQTKNGFIWFGHHYGLIRFDGSNYRMFSHDPDNPESITSGRIFHISAQDSFLWLGSDTGGISRFNIYSHKSVNWRHKTSDKHTLASNFVDGLYAESDSVVWVSTGSFCLNKLNTATHQVERYHPPIPYDWISNNKSAGPLYSILPDQDNDELLWIGSPFGIYQFDKTKRSFKLFTPEPDQADYTLKTSCRDLIIDNQGRLWAGTGRMTDPGEGLLRYDPQSDNWKRFKVIEGTAESTYTNRISEILQISENELLAGTRNGNLWLINTQNDSISFLSDDIRQYGLSIGDVYTLLKTSDDDIWLGSEQLIRVNRNRRTFNHINFDQYWKLNDRFNWVNCFAEDTLSGNIYIGTANGNGLISMDKYMKDIHLLGIPDNHIEFKSKLVINDILILDSLNFLLASNFGLIQYNPKDNDYKFLNDDKINDKNLEVKNLKLLNDTVVLMHKNTDFLLSYNLMSGSFQEIEIAANIEIADIEVNQNSIWIATSSGLIEYNIENRNYRSISQLNGVRINDIEIDGNKILLGTTGLGLYMIEQTKNKEFNVVAFNSGDGLSGNNIFQILLLKNGNIWMGSEPGFTQYFKTDQVFHQYLAEDGIPFSRQTGPLIELKDSKILTSGPRGFSSFTPRTNPSYKYKPNVHIQKIEVQGQAIDNTHTSLNLSPFENTITFSYSATDYCFPVKSIYKYQLEGLENTWQKRNSPGEITFSKLPPGEYVFKIKVANKNGIWSDTKEIPVSIETPLLAKWWFWALSATLVLSIMTLIYKRRLERVKQFTVMKAEFEKKLSKIEMEALRSQMNPHFLFNSLNSINNIILKRDAKEASNYLTKFARLIRMILQNSKSQKITLADELSSLKLYIELESLRFENRFSYDIYVGDNIDKESTLIAPMLIQPYIENAIWHGLMHKRENGNLIVDIKKEDNLLICFIEDDGVGRKRARELKSKSSTYKSYGMQITKHRIETVNKIYGINTSVEIEDLHKNGIPSGTRVIITIPILNNQIKQI